MKVVDVFSQRRVYGWYLNYLAVAGVFIDREELWKKYYASLTIFSLTGVGFLLNAMVMFLNDIDSFAVLMHHTTLLISFIIFIQVFFYNRKIVKETTKGSFKSFDYESPLVSQFLDDLQAKREKTMEKVFKYIMFTAVFMQINVIIFAIVEKYLRNLDFVLLFPCWFPFDLSYLPYHIIALFWQFSIINVLVLLICGGMTVLYVVNSHFTSQIILLKFAIEKLKARAYELASCAPDENTKETFEDKLRKSFIKGTNQCIKHYSMIIEYYLKVEERFRVLYLLVFLTGIFLLTTTGFALISDNTSLKIKFIGVNAVQMVYLYIFCGLTEKISDLGESIRLSIYGIEWYEMPKECQSSLKLMIERTLRPLYFHTLTGQRVDLENYMAMVKASYSYFNMILATQQK